MFGQMQPMGTRSVQFVNGRMSAEAYAMAPNSQEILMDMNRPVFYWKTTDASGMSSVQEYERFAQMEKQQLEQRISQLENQNQMMFIAQQMNNVVRYPNGFTWDAGANPFCCKTTTTTTATA